MTRAPGLTAITFNTDGGGVAAVARLVRQVVLDEWGVDAPVFELAASAAAPAALHRLLERTRFGAAVAAAQAGGRVAWMFHTHLAVARVQRFVPARLSCPYVVFLHGIEMWERVSPADRTVLDGARLIVTNSVHTARRAAAANPGLADIAVCPLGFAGSAGSWSPPADGTNATILTVGRMASTERYKGHDQLIDALPIIRRRAPAANLVFVGAGDDVERLRAKARSAGVADRVTFTGFLPDAALVRAYRAAAVFAMPSRGEGFGLTYLEAMAAGLPCIGSVHDAAPEVITDGVTGYLVDQQNIEELAARVSSLLVDPGRRIEMGRQGRRRWEREFTYDQFRRRLIALLDAPFRRQGGAAPEPSSVAG